MRKCIDLESHFICNLNQAGNFTLYIRVTGNEPLAVQNLHQRFQFQVAAGGI